MNRLNQVDETNGANARFDNNLGVRSAWQRT